MAIWKVSAAGDNVFIDASDKASAKTKLFSVMGKIPESMLTFMEIDELPEDEEFLC